MNYAGCKRKFKIPDYVAHVERCIAREKAAKRAAAGGPSAAPATAGFFGSRAK